MKTWQDYLVTTEDPSFPKTRADVVKKDQYNAERVNAFLTPEGTEGFFSNPIATKGVHTVMKADLPDGLLSAIFAQRPDILAMQHLHNQICSSCHEKEAQLYTCTCCHLFQACSKECLDKFTEKVPEHARTLRRFVDI